jgi:hypothetical protein
MSHKTPARSLHGEEDDDDNNAFVMGGGHFNPNDNKRPSMGIVSTSKFAILDLLQDTDDNVGDDDFFYDCGGDDPDNEEGEDDGDQQATAEELTSAQISHLAVQTHSIEELIQDQEFKDNYFSNVRKPALDPSYKYPKISVMVSFV